MHAMILDEKRDFCWAEVPDPVRKADEVLIRVRAAAVNRADLMQKDGCYSSPEGWPQWCGLEAAGEVVSAPKGSRFAPGDAVCALLGGGGYSEFVAVPEEMALPVPEGLSAIEAATLPEVWSTVYLNLQWEAGGIRPGDTFFVQSGASGVGMAAIQFAKSRGAKVITTVGSPAKAEFVRSLGADVVIDHRNEDVRQALAAAPPDIALDCVGGKLMGDCLKNMKFGGRWIMIASLAGGMTEIDLEVVWRKRLKLIGSTLRSRTSEEKGRILQGLEKELWPLFSARRLYSHIHATFPVAEVEKAHAVLRRAENIGKVVLTF